MDYKYKFSVVMAVYNIELFLREAIDSVIAQNIGFKNIQLILVDDGAKDSSGKICDEYAEKYPENILVIHKENGGVSSARNEGLEHIEGKYVNFLDGDDRFPVDAFKKIWNFFEKNREKTDMVSVPLMFFDGRVGDHVLNYKYKDGNRIVNLKEEWHFPQLHIGSTFIKKEAIEDIRFDSNLAYAEDAKVVQQVLLKKQTIGFFKDTEYGYRRRTEGEQSAIQRSLSNPKWYTPYMKHFQLETIQNAINKLGEVPRFVQFTLMYDLQWRIKRPELPAEILNEAQIEEYLASIKEILQHIDDVVIFNQRNLVKEQKIFVYKLKYGKEPKFNSIKDDAIYRFSDEATFKLSKCQVRIDNIDITSNTLKLEGFICFYNFPYGNLDVFVSVNDKKYFCDCVDRNISSKSLGSELLTGYGFNIEFPIEEGTVQKIKFGANINGENMLFNRICFRDFAPINNKFKNSYCKKENWIISANKNQIVVCPSTLKRRFFREVKYLRELLFGNRYGSKRAVFYRLQYRLHKLLRNKPIWLISDRGVLAGDNGEAFFRYMCANHKEIDARFVIAADSTDYKRMCKIGPTVKRDSHKHRSLFVLSDCIISSHAESDAFNPLRRKIFPLNDIWAEKKFVFLQHGIIQSDLSGWLNKYSKRFNGFIVSAKAEYDSIVGGNYFYDDEVWLTGLPRHDRLYNEPQRQITIMPTWRKYLADRRDDVTDTWSLADGFKESNYFIFYNSLLNSEKLLKAVKENKYKLAFFPHPTLQPYIELFETNDNVVFLDSITAYKDVYAYSDLIITDYSSAAFDFSYLRKPIIYTHFDKDEFFGGGHVGVTGYFEYERDGFGEVEYDLESTVDRIIEYMENGCELKDEYRQRIDKFFAFNDKNNCKRVYEKIMELGKK